VFFVGYFAKYLHILQRFVSSSLLVERSGSRRSSGCAMCGLKGSNKVRLALCAKAKRGQEGKNASFSLNFN